MWRALKALWARLATPENLWALVVCLIVIALLIVTTDNSPVWIYQGF